MTDLTELIAAQHCFRWCWECGARWSECGRYSKCCPDCRHRAVDGDPTNRPVTFSRGGDGERWALPGGAS